MENRIFRETVKEVNYEFGPYSNCTEISITVERRTDRETGEVDIIKTIKHLHYKNNATTKPYECYISTFRFINNKLDLESFHNTINKKEFFTYRTK